MLNQRKQEVVKEVIEVSSSADKLRIQDLESMLRRANEEYRVLENRRQEIQIVKETVQVSKEEDLMRISNLER